MAYNFRGRERRGERRTCEAKVSIGKSADQVLFLTQMSQVQILKNSELQKEKLQIKVLSQSLKLSKCNAKLQIKKMEC